MLYNQRFIQAIYAVHDRLSLQQPGDFSFALDVFQYFLILGDMYRCLLWFIIPLWLLLTFTLFGSENHFERLVVKGCISTFNCIWVSDDVYIDVARVVFSLALQFLDDRLRVGVLDSKTTLSGYILKGFRFLGLRL